MQPEFSKCEKCMKQLQQKLSPNSSYISLREILRNETVHISNSLKEKLPVK